MNLNIFTNDILTKSVHYEVVKNSFFYGIPLVAASVQFQVM